jgi:hypothetical protein
MSELVDFRRLTTVEGWGQGWLFLHYNRDRGVRSGWGYLRLPQGLDTTAPDQPIPGFLVDHECLDCEVSLEFRVDNPTLRPGVLVRGLGPHDFCGVTVEDDRIVCSAFTRASRQLLASAPIRRLAAARRYELRIRARGPRIQASFVPAGVPPDWQLDIALSEPQRDGSPGVLLLHPTNLDLATIEVARYEVTAAAFEATPPRITYLLCGPPELSDAGHRATLRAGASLPSDIRFEWANESGFRLAEGTKWIRADTPPYTAAAAAELNASGTIYWRAILRSRSTGKTTVSDPQSISLPDPTEQLTLLAGSCVQFYQEQPTYGYRRLTASSPTTPALMIFQGDLGYANNRFHSCYAAEEDFFADRFIRFLADPLFGELRSVVPTGFTLDDHDYGPRNNADRTTIAPWVAPLWDRIGADPSDRGYFDVVFGDIHCFTLDGRRYADPITSPNTPIKTKLGAAQRSWLEQRFRSSDANLFVIFSGDIFASRYTVPHSSNVPDCFSGGWPNEYRALMSLFFAAQDAGRRVVILSGDAHGLRVHYHRRPSHTDTDSPVVEFICSGLRPRRWSGAATGDPTLDPQRNVLGRAGAGLLTVDSLATPDRQVTLRAISGDDGGSPDLFPPLILPFRP